MTHYSNKQLIKKLKSRNSNQEDEAMRALLQKYKQKITYIFLAKSAKQNDIEEAIHDGLLGLMNSIQKDRLDGREQTLEAYFIGICKNKLYDKFHKNKNNNLEDLDQINSNDITNGNNTLDHIISKEREEWLRDLIKRLGKNCQEILERYYYQEQKMKAIAEAMNYANEQVARNKKSKCLKKLREIMDNLDRF